jgi:hypothetical protein
MPIDETPVKLVVDDSNLKEDQLENTNIEIENVSCQENIEDFNNAVQSLSKTNIEKSESINHCDSFWIDPVANNELDEKIPNEDFNSSCKHNEKGVPDVIHISYQNSNADEFSSEINPLENDHVNTPDENRFQVDENANDTDLDQTFNLNGSYEISPNKIESSFEIVNRVIDCSELENDDEHEKENDGPIEILNLEDKNYENKTIVFMQTTTTIIADIQTNVNEEESNIDQNNEENLTIIIPEELNKIKFQDEEEEDETEETDENEKQLIESEKNSSYEIKEVSKKLLSGCLKLI